MPIDPSIPLAAQAPRFNSLGDSFMRAFQMRDQIESSRALREQRDAIAEDRRAQTEKRKREEANQRAAATAFEQGGGTRDKTLAWATAHAPQLVPELSEFFDKSDKSAAEIRKLQQDLQDRKANHIGTSADYILKHFDMPGALDTGLAYHAELFPDEAPDVQQMGERLKGLQPDQVKSFLERLRDNSPEYRERAAKAPMPQPFSLSPGETRYDANGHVIATAAPKPEAAPSVGSFEDYLTRVAAERGRTPKQLSPYDIEQARKKYNQADDRPREAAQARPLTQTAEAAMIARLAGTWDKANANSQELARQSSMMRTAINRFDNDPNAASQAVLSTFNKILDPQSVVRESEYARSAQGLSLMDRMRGAIERIQRGGAGVPKAQLQSMASMAEEFVRNSKDATGGLRKRLGSTADRYNIPHDLIFTDTTLPTQTAPSPPSTTAPGVPSYQDYLNSRKPKGGG